jgi:hypothetical protein
MKKAAAGVEISDGPPERLKAMRASASAGGRLKAKGK